MADMRRGEWTFQAVGPGRWRVVDWRGYPIGYPDKVEEYEYLNMAEARREADIRSRGIVR